MKTTKYVIQNSKGEFYWRGDVLSIYGFHQDFNEAFLFKTRQRAESRMRLFDNCIVREVELKLI